MGSNSYCSSIRSSEAKVFGFGTHLMEKVLFTAQRQSDSKYHSLRSVVIIVVINSKAGEFYNKL